MDIEVLKPSVDWSSPYFRGGCVYDILVGLCRKMRPDVVMDGRCYGEVGLMGRPVFYRQRIRSQAASVEAKSLLAHLASEIRLRREVALEEAWLIAMDAYRFLMRGLLNIGPGEVEFPCIAGRNSHFRQARRDQPEKVVRIMVVAEEDISLVEEFGIRTMQQGRLARIIEEAYWEDALLDARRLCVVMPLTMAAIRERLRGLWDQGVLLPICGMTYESRKKLKLPRGVLAVKRYLLGEELTSIRRELAISRIRWQEWWRAFQEAAIRLGDDPEVVAKDLGYPVELVEGWQSLWEEHRDIPVARERAGKLVQIVPSGLPLDEEERVYDKLIRDHRYTSASARSFVQELRDLAFRINRVERRPGEIIAFGVALDEPPGRSLAEARLSMVVLDYVASEDWGLVDKTSPKELKWRRLERLTTQAYEQGVALSLPDLSHLLGISVDAIQKAMKDHDKVVLPTRGRVADMGSTLSHAEKIIALYMDGYTETEIKRRTGHSYDSIERYLWDFSRVVYLCERGMPLPAIRQALGMSRRVVSKYLELYERFRHPDYVFRMARIRRMVEVEGPPKKVKGILAKEVMEMRDGKGGKSRYAALPARDVELVQGSHLRERFELAPHSQLAEEVVRRTNEALKAYEAEVKRERVEPGEVLIEHEGKKVYLPLFSPAWGRKLSEGLSVVAVRRHLEHEQLETLTRVDPQVTLEDLWRWTDQKELACSRGRRGDFLPPEPFNSEATVVYPRRLEDISLPESVVAPIVSGLVEDYGPRPALARAMVELAAQIRQWCSPRVEELVPGQAVWLAYSTRRPRRGSPRLVVPVVLTLITPEEWAMSITSRNDLKRLKVRQLERITTEAWKQDGVLTMLDLEWLLNVNSGLLRELLEAYQERFGVVLPTAGTVLDMGRTLTHKTIVVEMALSGMNTQEIARRIYHSPEAVDQYLRAFDRVLVLRHFGLPVKLMVQVTGHSMGLIEEHLALAEKHFPTREALIQYLTSRGVDLEGVG